VNCRATTALAPSPTCALEDVAPGAATLGKPVVAFTPFIIGATDYGRMVRAQIPHVPVMRDVERTLRVMRALADAGTRRIASGPPAAAADHALARSWRARAATLAGPSALNEVESKALLRAYGIPIPQERLVKTAEGGGGRELLLSCSSAPAAIRTRAMPAWSGSTTATTRQ
jgi:acyl-CoA synthetase (NDP forming)